MNLQRFRKIIFDLWVQPLCQLGDRLMPKKKNHWGFPVHHIKSEQFIENARAVFECVKTDPGIKKIIFCRSEKPEFELEGAQNTQVVLLQSWRGLVAIMQCRVLFVTHSISMDYSFRWGEGRFSVLKLSLRKRVVVNLWHGIISKGLYALANPVVRARLDRVKFRRKERAGYAGLICSSETDRYAMTATFHPIHPDRVWMTGLPRNDFLRREFEALPAYLRGQIERVRELKQGRRLVLYAPTYRQTAAIPDAVYYQFSEEEITQLRDMLRRQRAILGFRMHYFRNSAALFNLEQFVDGETIVSLGHAVVPEIAAAIREADVVLTDYSSVYTDAIYLDKPLVSFAYDLEEYRRNQDGLLYDMEIAFPGIVVRDFASALQEMERQLSAPPGLISEKQRLIRRLFYAYLDDRNAERVVARVRALQEARARP